MSTTLVIYPPTTTHLGLLNDLAMRNDVELFEAGYTRTSGVGNTIRRIHLSQKVNRFIDLPNKKFWYRQIPFSDLNPSRVLIFDGALNYMDYKELKLYKERLGNVPFFLFMINAIEAKSPTISNIKDFIFSFPWDKVMTFDPGDAERYHWVYKSFCYYSNKYNYQCNKEVISDLCFTAGIKGGRHAEIIEIYEYLTKHGVKCDFRLMTYSKVTPESKPGLTYIPVGWRPYEEVLSSVCKSNCILEILQTGQAGASLRYFEAVCNNKKLLTNNPHIVDFPYYDSRYMKVYSTIEEIDVDWIKSNDAIDYGYQGDFSPNTLVDSLNFN